MKTYSFILFALLLLSNIAAANNKEIYATRIHGKVTIDGKLDEAVWQNTDVATEFTNFSPNPGTKCEAKTLVRIVYDDEAIYIAATMSDVKANIMTELSERDDFGNTDRFGVFFDTYGNANDGFLFMVGSTGVQLDSRIIKNRGEDDSWDAVWESSTTIGNDGWTVEMKIPYSAIRFPKSEIQNWHVNFIRRRAKQNEDSVWNEVDPEKDNTFLTQTGVLNGIQDIKPPLRLSFSPYVSAYVQNSHLRERNPASITGTSYNLGADLKFGITDAFTLDMTLIPDFGQVQSDDKVLNLSPFEQQYSEKRPFFTEGLELFDRGNIFYTRRVGGTPIGKYNVTYDSSTEKIIANSDRTQLYNAAKISGRTKNGLGIGFFNAISAKTYAKIENLETQEVREELTSPLTNYSVLVLDQSLRNNSSITFINTNVTRQGNQFYNANVSGLELDLNNAKKTYGIEGKTILSQKYYPSAENDFGHSYNLFLKKISGKFQGGFGYIEESPDFDPNDLGFLRSPNERGLALWANYSIYEPFSIFNRANFWFNFNYNRLVEPNVFTGAHTNIGLWVQTKSFWNFNMWSNLQPVSYDYYEPRVQGRYLKEPKDGNIGLYIGSDNRKRFKMSVSSFISKADQAGRYGYEFSIRPRYRFSDHFSMSFRSSYEGNKNDIGWVDLDLNGDIYFGRRNLETVSNRISATYTINNKMILNFRLRHYWSKGVYNHYYALDNEGELLATSYDGFNDFSFNQFNIDLEYKWRFAPGSDIVFVWKNNISNNDTSIDSVNYNKLKYRDGVTNLTSLEQINSLSVRFTYYMDYQRFRR